jgi:hypothetical protein
LGMLASVGQRVNRSWTRERLSPRPLSRVVEDVPATRPDVQINRAAAGIPPRPFPYIKERKAEQREALGRVSRADLRPASQSIVAAKAAQHVVRTDEADEEMVLVHDIELMHVQRQQLFDHQLDRHARRHREHRRRHNVAHRRAVDGRRQGGAQPLALVDENVGPADDADRPAGLVDHRRGAETFFGQPGDGLRNGRLSANRHRVGRHQVGGSRGVQGQTGRTRHSQRTRHWTPRFGTAKRRGTGNRPLEWMIAGGAPRSKNKVENPNRGIGVVRSRRPFTMSGTTEENIKTIHDGRKIYAGDTVGGRGRVGGVSGGVQPGRRGRRPVQERQQGARKAGFRPGHHPVHPLAETQSEKSDRLLVSRRRLRS